MKNQQANLLTPNGVRETVSRVSGEQIRLSPSNPYGMLTLTRKNRLAAFVGPHEPSVRLSRPSTVYTRSCFVPPSFKSGSQPISGSPSALIEITVRTKSDVPCGAEILAQSPPRPQRSDYPKGEVSSPSEPTFVENQQANLLTPNGVRETMRLMGFKLTTSQTCPRLRKIRSLQNL